MTLPLFVVQPVARVGEFDRSASQRRWKFLTVLRSIPVMREISRWVLPRSSSV